MDVYIYVVVFLYDFKIDDNVLYFFLLLEVVYIGVLGSCKMYVKWVKCLEEVGFDEEVIVCIKVLIGLFIKVKKFKEIVMSIMVEIISV